MAAFGRYFYGDRRFRRFTLICLAVPNIVFLPVQIAALRDAHRYIREGQATWGTVTAFHPDDHYRLSAKYVVGGATYHVYSGAPERTDGIRGFRPGERVPVYYFASEPQSGVFEKPVWNTGWELFQTLVTGYFCLIPVLAYVALRMAFRIDHIDHNP